MNRLIGYMDRLNRKERFFVVAQALGDDRLTPDSAYLATVEAATGVTFPDSAQVHCFIDFHLDWLYAALVLASADSTGAFQSPGFAAGDPDSPTWNVNTNQEDIDLLLAFEDGLTTHLVMVEAKATTGWTLRQVASKTRRLRHIFGEDGQAFEGVEPHFMLMSPKPPVILDAKLSAYGGGPPQWMRIGGNLAWAELIVPQDRLVITRCDAEGTAMKSGEWWSVTGPDPGPAR